jgi:3-keto-disaccharide hydrolase
MTRCVAMVVRAGLAVMAAGMAVCVAAGDSGSAAPRHAQIDLARTAGQAAGERRQGFTRVIAISPKAADSAEATHAALLVTRQHYTGAITFGGRVQTVRQLRTGSPPNPWECAWLVWHYQDEHHFYYVAIKPTGWEIGKRDPAYPGGQRFLASGSDRFAIGAWHDFFISQQGNVITVRLNGVEIASFADDERPYGRGNLGLYTEDAEVQLDDVTAPFVQDFEAYSPMTSTAEGLVINDWIAPFLGYGQVAVVDRQR